MAEMSVVRRAITIPAFVMDGKPTCSIGRESAATCAFLLARKWGMVFCCKYTARDLEREGEVGRLIPDEDCPVWAGGQ